MKIDLRLLTVALAAGSLQLVCAADITGKITLSGTPPPEKRIVMDALCAQTHAGRGPVTTSHYVVGDNKGLANVLVYIKDEVPGDFTPPSEVPVLDQVDCIYTPYVMGVMSGQKFQVKNSDPLLHNVNTTRTRFNNPKNKPFNIAQPTKGMTRDVTYYGREVFVRFHCDVHPWMFGYVAVIEHPFFAVTDENGNFKIAGVPPGKYTLEAIHLKAGTQTREITVDGDQKVEFTMEAK